MSALLCAARFRSEPVVGQYVTVSHVMMSRKGKTRRVDSAGVYLGVLESEWEPGEMMHMFSGGYIGGTPQRGRHGFPVAHVVAN